MSGILPPETRHVIVLMLENRSFDHMLGWLPLPSMDGLRGGPTYSNVDPDTGRSVLVSEHATPTQAPDPAHDFMEVNRQVFGSPTPSAGVPPTMGGFVASYKSAGSRRAEEIMACFPAWSLPVLHTLAQHFTVCDRWFSSVPGPTWTNRTFLLAGTSGGHVDNWRSRLHVASIFDRVPSYRVYFHDAPQSWFVGRHPAAHFRLFRRNFAQDVASSDLPFFTLIEPHYGVLPGVANDQHPPHDVRQGEALLKRVYEVLRASALWKGSVLVVLYDEHGGFFDHVPPPGARPPEAAPPTPNEYGFGFDRLGIRVPALVISPYARRHVLHTVCDHTSIMATVLRTLGEGAMSQRDGHAVDLGGSFGNYRDDTPLVLPDAVRATPFRVSMMPAPATWSDPTMDQPAEGMTAFQKHLLEGLAADMAVSWDGTAEEGRVLAGRAVTELLGQDPE